MKLGVTELVIILVIVLLLFGAKRLPELAKSMGKGINEFKKGMSGEVEEKKDPGEKKS
jgi:TatA/E family protein of Tat protein translocase